MYGFGGVGLSEVQISISELSVVGGWWVGGWWWTGQTHFMVGPGRGPTKIRPFGWKFGWPGSPYEILLAQRTPLVFQEELPT